MVVVLVLLDGEASETAEVLAGAAVVSLSVITDSVVFVELLLVVDVVLVVTVVVVSRVEVLTTVVVVVGGIGAGTFPSRSLISHDVARYPAVTPLVQPM